MPSPEQLEELQRLLPQVATPDTTLAVINGRAIAAKDLLEELKKMPTPDISSLIEDLKMLDKPFACEKTPDEEMGMKWWNGMSETERAEVLRQAHEIIPNPSAADAWKLWRANRVRMEPNACVSHAGADAHKNK